MKSLTALLIIALAMPVGITLQIKNEERQQCHAQRDALTKTSWSLKRGCQIKRFVVYGRMV